MTQRIMQITPHQLWLLSLYPQPQEQALPLVPAQARPRPHPLALSPRRLCRTRRTPL